jgi:hypothetical protein
LRRRILAGPIADKKQGSESEWIWLLVEGSHDEKRLVFGKLDSEPVVHTDMRLGMELAVRVSGAAALNPATTSRASDARVAVHPHAGLHVFGLKTAIMRVVDR